MNPFVLEKVVDAMVADARMKGPLPAENEGLPGAHQSRRSRAIRRISEIVNGRGWQIEVLRALDRHGASYVSDLPDEAVDTLCARLEYFEDCVQTCCDPDDAPPAR